MAGPATYGGLGVRGGGLGLMGLGAAQQPQPFALSAMPSTALPYIAHLYTNGMQFKRTLGDAASVGGSAGSAFVTKPGLKMTINGGYHPVTLELAGAQSPSNLVADPGFEASDDIPGVQANWALTTVGEWALMTTAPDIRKGRRAMKCTRTNLGPNNWNVLSSKVRIPITPGATYTVSLWSKQIAGTVSSYGGIHWLKADGVTDASTGVSYAKSNVSGVQPWTFYTLSVVAPPDAAYAQMWMPAGWWDGVTGTNAQTWYDEARIVLGTDSADPIALGDIIQLTEQGDPASTILYTGIVEEIPDEVGAGPSGTKHQVLLTPLVAELGDTDFSQQYLVATDVAQMVRDAVNKTAHCRVSQASCGDTGVLALYDFNQTNSLEVLNVAKRIAGVNFWWFVDASGLVWFQSTTPANPADITLKRGSDFTRRKRTTSIVGMKNKLLAIGGFPNGSATAIQSPYSNVVSQKRYGVRRMDPGPIFPTVTDQATLDKIAATIGSALDRVHTTVLLDLPGYSSRLSLGVPGGLTARLQEPAAESFPQSTAVGSGGFEGPYVAQDIEVIGRQQMVIWGDIPITGLQDIQYELDRIVQRLSALPATYGP